MAQIPTTAVAKPKSATPVKAVAEPKEAPPFKIQERHTSVRYLKALIYADFGVGKTFLAGTSAAVKRMQDVVILNVEAGDLTYDVKPDKDPFNFGAIDSIPIPDYKAIGHVFDYLKLHCQLRDAGNIERMAELEGRFKDKVIDPKKCKHYRTAILDSLTEIDQYSLNQLLGVTNDTRLDEEVPGAEWAEYKKNSGMIRRLVRNFRDLPMHVILICSRDYTQDENKRFNFTPAMTGALSKHVQGFVDIVGYLQAGNVTEDGKVQRRLYVHPVGKFAAKCRFTSFKGTFFEDPTMEKILSQVGLLELAAK